MTRPSWNWSIERKLPLLISGLLALVIGGFSWAAYDQVRREALATADERLDGVARQLETMLAGNVRNLRAQIAPAAARPALRAYLGAPGPVTRTQALLALREVASVGQMTAAAELWDASAQPVLQTAALPPMDPAVVTTLRATLAGADSTAVGPLHVVNDTLLFPVVAVIRDGERTIGYAVQRRRVAASPQAVQLLAGLIGSEAALLVGNVGTDLWTDFAVRVPAPPVDVGDRVGLLEYERDRGRVLAHWAAITGTPWAVLIEFPREPVLAGARRFLGRVLLIAVALVLASGVGAWALSRRITGPLALVTDAAEAIAAGDLAPRAHVSSTDELGRLARSFNTMAEQVGRAQHRLEAEVTERTRDLEIAKRQIEQTSEERYRTLFERNPLPMWLYDPATLAFLAVNDAAVRHYGYSRDEFLRMTLKDIRPPEDVPRFLASLSDAPSGLYEAGVWGHRRKDGTIVQVEVTRHRLRIDGREVGLVLAHDVTARLQAEEALRRVNTDLEARVRERTHALASSEERFRALAETANDAIVSADRRGVIVYVNRAVERTFGYPAAMLVGQPLTLLMPASLRDAHRAGLARFLETGQARVVGRTVELVGQRRDGAEFPIELSLACWRSPAGPSFTGILRDITERKRIEEALRQTNAELEAFSYSVSHDLRAPLRAIHGFARMLVEDHGAQLAEEPRRLLTVIDDNTRRMGQLIDDLLAFSRLGRKELETSRVNMTELVRSIADDLRRAEGDRPLDIQIDPLPPARGDRDLLRQVVTNVLQNAVKFTRGRSPTHIHVGHRADDQGGVYYVKDNGAGFDQRYADKLFGVFQRLHRADEFEGTGVGLAIVQRIVHRHGGRVWAEGVVNEGATFYFSLPGAADA
ncbi:MAG TPA: PAS domain S-box protein [Gemmatimonadales bacterium]